MGEPNYLKLPADLHNLNWSRRQDRLRYMLIFFEAYLHGIPWVNLAYRDDGTEYSVRGRLHRTPSLRLWPVTTRKKILVRSKWLDIFSWILLTIRSSPESSFYYPKKKLSALKLKAWSLESWKVSGRHIVFPSSEGFPKSSAHYSILTLWYSSPSLFPRYYYREVVENSRNWCICPPRIDGAYELMAQRSRYRFW